MRKFTVTLLPLILLIPLLLLNVIMSFGTDFIIPDFYSFYPFPFTICQPLCQNYPIGMIISAIYWISGFLLYLKFLNLKKNSLPAAYTGTAVFGGFALLLILAHFIYAKLFIPKGILNITLPSAL